MHTYYIYILTNKKNGTLYVGVTSDIARRVWEHKKKLVKGFTSKYNLNKLVYMEMFDDIYTAIHREKRIKEWPRVNKIRLIEKDNPYWYDLYNNIGELIL